MSDVLQPAGTTGSAMLPEGNIPTAPSTAMEIKPGKLGAMLMLAGAVLYLISPVDLIPDVIPVLCHLDDVGIMGMAIKRCAKAFA